MYEQLEAKLTARGQKSSWQETFQLFINLNLGTVEGNAV
jgi:hypothetical protein